MDSRRGSRLTADQQALVMAHSEIAERVANYIRLPRGVTREDVRAEAYYQLCRAASLCRKGEPFPKFAWLLVTQGVRRAIGRNLRFVVHRTWVDDLLVNTGQIAIKHRACTEDPLGDLAAREELERLRAAIDSLSPAQQRAVRCRLAGLPFRTLAKSRVTGSMNFRRALKHLRDRLDVTPH